MLTINEYFDGNVKSVGFLDNSGKASVGVMAPGTYEFGTAAPELMRVVSGSLKVRLPDSEQWICFGPGQEFNVPANSKFYLEVSEASSYLCRYL